MKKLIISASVAVMALAVAAPAMASDTDSQSFDVTATVQPECSIADPNDVVFGNVAVDENPGPGALLLTTNLQNNNQNVWTSCNYGARMTISSANNGLVNPEPNDGNDAADFTNVIEYRVSMTAAANSAFLTTHLFTTSNTPGSRVNTDAFHDNANLRVYIFQGDNPLRPLAGTYSDVATITVGPV